MQTEDSDEWKTLIRCSAWNEESHLVLSWMVGLERASFNVARGRHCPGIPRRQSSSRLVGLLECNSGRTKPRVSDDNATMGPLCRWAEPARGQGDSPGLECSASRVLGQGPCSPLSHVIARVNGNPTSRAHSTMTCHSNLKLFRSAYIEALVVTMASGLVLLDILKATVAFSQTNPITPITFGPFFASPFPTLLV